MRNLRILNLEKLFFELVEFVEQYAHLTDQILFSEKNDDVFGPF